MQGFCIIGTEKLETKVKESCLEDPQYIMITDCDTHILLPFFFNIRTKYCRINQTNINLITLSISKRLIEEEKGKRKKSFVSMIMTEKKGFFRLN